MRASICLLWLFVVLASGAAAQPDIGCAGPTLGYVLQPGVGVRPVVGIPGSARIADPLPIGIEISSIAVSPQLNFILAIAGGEREGMLIDTLTLATSKAAGARPGLDRVFLSPSGRAAAVYSERAAHLQILGGLPDRAEVTADLDLSALGGRLRALALNDGASSVLVATDGGLFRLNRGNQVQRIAWTGAFTAVSFLHGSNDALVADRAAHTVSLLRDSGEITLLATESDGVRDPLAVAASEGNTRAVVGMPRAVASLALGEGAAVTTPCQCEITSLERLCGRSVFRLTELSHGPLWVFDGDGEPRVVFVPAALEGEPGGAQ